MTATGTRREATSAVGSRRKRYGWAVAVTAAYNPDARSRAPAAPVVVAMLAPGRAGAGLRRRTAACRSVRSCTAPRAFRSTRRRGSSSRSSPRSQIGSPGSALTAVGRTGSSGSPSREPLWSAPLGQRRTTSATSAAAAPSGLIHGRAADVEHSRQPAQALGRMQAAPRVERDLDLAALVRRFTARTAPAPPSGTRSSVLAVALDVGVHEGAERAASRGRGRARRRASRRPAAEPSPCPRTRRRSPCG